jgi:acyl-CoA synthetase (NDP forming)
LKYLTQDTATRVIAFYVEGFEKNEGRAFVQEAAIQCGKPVIVLKAGKSARGSRAVASHTASLAGDYTVFSQVLSQHGIVEAKDEFEMVSFCESLSCYQRPISGRVGIITASGGHGVIAVDTCAGHGLTVPQLTAEIERGIQEQLTASVRPIASLGNPVGLTGSAVDEDFIVAATGLSSSADIDCVLILLLPYSPGISSDLGARLADVYQREGKPMVAYVPHEEKYRMLIEGFELNRIPVSSSIEGAVLMAEAMRRCQPC